MSTRIIPLDTIAAQLQADAPQPEPAPVYTVQWEDGVTVSTPLTVASKAEAFGTLDAWFTAVEYPASLRVVIRENGAPVWIQHGTHIELNA